MALVNAAHAVALTVADAGERSLYQQLAHQVNMLLLLLPGTNLVLQWQGQHPQTWHMICTAATAAAVLRADPHPLHCSLSLLHHRPLLHYPRQYKCQCHGPCY
jgi:hypothetical protein